MSTITARDARDYVLAAIAATGRRMPDGDAVRAVEAECNIDAIVSELHDLAGGWDFDKVDHDTFWQVIARHMP